MDCTECGNDVLLVKKTKVLYDGIRVKDVFLRNCEVEVCRHCGVESPVVRNIQKVHLMIAVGIAFQPARLTGDEVRFLRRSMRLSSAEWAVRIGISPETYSRWENGRSPARQVEKLARIDFLMSVSRNVPLDFVQDGILEVLASDFEETRDFALLIDCDDLDARPEYANLATPEFATPSHSFIEAMSLDAELFADVGLYGGKKMPFADHSDFIFSGESQNARDAFALAA